MNARLLAVGAAVGVLTACAQGSPSPYPVGLTVHGTGSGSSTVIDYRVTAGGSPVESTGVAGNGDSCSAAAESNGTTNTVSSYSWDTNWQVIGETHSSHPLYPGHDRFGNETISVVKDTTTMEESSFSTMTFHVNGGDPEDWTETEGSEDGIETVASYYGVAADEYIVKMTSLANLWDDLEAGEANVLLMSRQNPGTGDIWSSVNGKYLYVYEGKEKLALAGQNMTTDKIGVYVVGDVDPTAGSILSDCLITGGYEYTSSDPDDDNRSYTDVFLDPQCDGTFVHLRSGTEWWYNNALVQSETTDYIVSIADYGYEWYESGGGNCSRSTSSNNRQEPDAVLFMEYQVRTETESWSVDSFAKAKGELVSAAD